MSRPDWTMCYGVTSISAGAGARAWAQVSDFAGVGRRSTRERSQLAFQVVLRVRRDQPAGVSAGGRRGGVGDGPVTVQQRVEQHERLRGRRDRTGRAHRPRSTRPERLRRLRLLRARLCRTRIRHLRLRVVRVRRGRPASDRPRCGVRWWLSDCGPRTWLPPAGYPPGGYGAAYPADGSPGAR